MNPVTYPLKLHMKGDTVKDLQYSLSILGYSISKKETTEQKFGSSTQISVIKFQEEHNLPPTGEVDENTAKLIKQAKTAKTSSQPKSLIIKGQVLYPDGRPYTTCIVRAFDKDLRSEQLLGEVKVDRQGHYEILYSTDQFLRAEKNNADLVVRAFDKKDLQIGVSSVLFNASPLRLLTLFQAEVSIVVHLSMSNLSEI